VKARQDVSEVAIDVRISAATPEADLAAAIWPGINSVRYARCESASQIQAADAQITRLERLRGICPGRVVVRPIIESCRGVTCSAEIAASSPRVGAIELGPSITLELGEDALSYARSECELHARARRLTAVDPFVSYD
jgi:citrate lyase beta subunit